MNRRKFLKAASYAGLGLVSPFGITRARAANEPYDGLFFVMINAGGGWDPTSLCDPKGRANEMEADPMNMYFKDDIQQAGNISYAPVPGLQPFFEKHHQKLLVINGVDTSTNGHDSGTRHTWSGNLAEGYPAFSALAAASLGLEQPLSFMSFGGYDDTQGIVAPTRTGNVGVLERIAYPNRIDTQSNASLFHSAETQQRIQRTLAERSGKMMGQSTLPIRRNALSSLMIARSGENDISRLIDFLPTLDNSNNRMRRQAQLAIAGYKAGVCVSANLNAGGFDTHGDHDDRHFPRLVGLMDGVDFLLDEAERQGVADKVVVAIGSEFGRTPGYNAGNGKDHWSITSMMFAGAGISGNRVIGATTERHRPLKVNPTSLALDEAGIRITPGHVHRALRKLAGIDAGDIAQLFPIRAEDLPLFA
jgi:uncharacterized protein (DUF1501 family)